MSVIVGRSQTLCLAMNLQKELCHRVRNQRADSIGPVMPMPYETPIALSSQEIEWIEQIDWTEQNEETLEETTTRNSHDVSPTRDQ